MVRSHDLAILMPCPEREIMRLCEFVNPQIRDFGAGLCNLVHINKDFNPFWFPK